MRDRSPRRGLPRESDAARSPFQFSRAAPAADRRTPAWCRRNRNTREPCGADDRGFQLAAAARAPRREVLGRENTPAIGKRTASFIADRDAAIPPDSRQRMMRGDEDVSGLALPHQPFESAAVVGDAIAVDRPASPKILDAAIHDVHADCPDQYKDDAGGSRVSSKSSSAAAAEPTTRRGLQRARPQDTAPERTTSTAVRRAA